jgi:minichromosome maintenance protein 10
MDDLIALMDEDDAAREEDQAAPLPSSSSSSAPMDNLLTLMEDNPLQEEHPFVSSPPRRESSRAVTPPRDGRTSASRSTTTATATTAKPSDVGVDNRLGIRMLNRNMSSVDLLDLISSNPYYSPASLSAMSLAALNRLLVDPTAIVDKSTVCGKTNVVTVGVVFSNTGTRISAKGSAFCVMTIGTLVSGPCLTVMLFGEPYSKYCKSCTPGKVVALCQPKLLPPKADNNGGSQQQQTSVSFAAYDARQFQLVAMDRDYGTCQGSVRVNNKQDNGSWTPTTKTCRHYVDKRQSPYCQTHRKQQYAQNGNSNSGRGGVSSNNNMTFMQQMRQDHGPKSAVTAVPTKGGGNLVVNSNVAATPNRFLNPTASSAAPTNNTATGALQRNVPMHMKKQSQMPTNLRSSASTNNSNNKASTNALLKRTNLSIPKTKARGIVGGGSNPTANNTKKGMVGKMSKTQTGTGSDWLHSKIQPPKKQPTTTTKKRSISNFGGGFDGSVVVPKPSRIFAAAPTPIRTCRVATSAAVDEVPVGQILNQQSELAKRLKEGKPALSALQARKTSKVNNPYQKAATTRNTNNKTLEDSLFGSIQVDTDKILQAKSRFAHEADALEYAKSRQAVLELEKLEAQQEATEKKKGGVDEQKKYVKEWTCEACGSRSSNKPNHCVRAGHTVKLRRSIQKQVTKEESRTKLHDKSVEDGGLSLGAGLEWSRFDRYQS